MICPHCGKPSSLREYDPAEYKRRKIANGLASLEKMRLNGKRGGRKRIRDDEMIKKLRAKGLSIRAIAKEIGLSTTAVQRGLRSG